MQKTVIAIAMLLLTTDAAMAQKGTDLVDYRNVTYKSEDARQIDGSRASYIDCLLRQIASTHDMNKKPLKIQNGRAVADACKSEQDLYYSAIFAKLVQKHGNPQPGQVIVTPFQAIDKVTRATFAAAEEAYK